MFMTVPFTHIDRLYIGGQWVRPTSGLDEAIVNPATEAVIGIAPVGGKEDAGAAIAAARHAFDHGPWPLMSMTERAEIMLHMHDALERRLPEIRALITAEAGAPQGITNLTQSATPLRLMKATIEMARGIGVETTPVEIMPDPAGGGPDRIGAATILHEPVGVVTGITAYNFPFFLNLSKVLPALLAGNTMVLKPSPFTPYAALLFGEIADEIGLPAGVLNIVTGGLDVGQMITSDPAVDMISFTGSDKVGAAIVAQSAPTLKRTVMELGGKSALIVCADADVQQAAMMAVVNYTAHAGQGCALLTRFIVHNAIRVRFVEAMREILASWKVGDPSDPSVMMGPVIRESQRQSVERFIEIGRDSGAKLVSGGRRPAALSKGFFLEPTLFDDVDNRSAIAQEEIFGPVAVVMGFSTEEEAIDLANDSKYGLSGAVMSKDRAAGFRIAARMRTGGVALNGGYGGDVSPHMPFGGYKRSGMGREYGSRWLHEYMNEKVIHYPIG
jgi:acyl-CoA reductase-like NAD-dependent aldehyde dehydrogenase